MESPNRGYFALKSRKGFDSGQPTVYLSSDGAGNLQLKQANNTKYPPPLENPFIDVALLFRLVEPTTKMKWVSNKIYLKRNQSNLG